MPSTGACQRYNNWLPKPAGYGLVRGPCVPIDHRWRLMVTARGEAARSDPSALWFQLAERMPLTSKDLCEEQGRASLSHRGRGRRQRPRRVRRRHARRHRLEAPRPHTDHDVVGGAHNEEHQRRAAAAPAAGTGQSSREARACHTASGGVRPRRGAVVAIRREIDTTVVILAGSQPYPRFAARLSTQAPAPRGRSRIQSYSTMEVAHANDAAIEHHTPKRHG